MGKEGEKCVESAVGQAASTVQKLKHVSTLFALIATPHPDMYWRFVVLHYESEKEAFLSTAWPFQGNATAIAVEDHSVLPSRVLQEWRTDLCTRIQIDSTCQHLQSSGHQLVDCNVSSL